MKAKVVRIRFKIGPMVQSSSTPMFELKINCTNPKWDINRRPEKRLIDRYIWFCMYCILKANTRIYWNICTINLWPTHRRHAMYCYCIMSNLRLDPAKSPYCWQNCIFCTFYLHDPFRRNHVIHSQPSSQISMTDTDRNTEVHLSFKLTTFTKFLCVSYLRSSTLSVYDTAVLFSV